MRVLVTGFNGFVGSAVTRELVSSGSEVFGLSRRSRGGFQGVKSINADLTSNFDAKMIDCEFDAVVHCAGLAHQPYQTPREKFFDINVTGTTNIARFAVENNIRHFIHISTVSVYGNNGYNGLIAENSECVPESPYAVSKLRSEEVCREIFSGCAATLTILRPSTVVGPGDRGNILRLIKALDSGFFIKIGDGDNLKSFVYVEDLAKAVKLVLDCENLQSDVYNVTAAPIAVGEVIETISHALGRRPPRLRLPLAAVIRPLQLLGRVAGSSRIDALKNALEKWVSEDAFDGTRLGEIVDIPTSAAESLKREVEWFMTTK